ncbi:hypothetical protein MXB_71 [Myxobolus squamalis]|nr:hypothetical protein MXB_71 [Myxobolus squamalis]
MPECSYEVNIYKLGMIAAKEAAKMKAKKFIQITSARIKIIEENRNRQDSVTEILECEKRLEDDLKSISGFKTSLNYTILRPSLVYGSGDKHGLSFTLMPLISAPMIILMSIYKKLKEPLVLLWEPTIPVSTVHVHDVVSACLFCTKIENSGDIFELCDESESSIS